jgi:hypothetical protein
MEKQRALTDGLPAWPGPPAQEPARSRWPTRPEYAFKAASALLTAAAWLSIGYGLFYGTYDLHALDELDGGGSFALGVFLYLPYVAMTAVVVGAALVALFPRPRNLVLPAVTVGPVLGFALWTMLWRDLYGLRPDLPLHSSTAALLASLGSAAVGLAHLAQRRSGSRTFSSHPR